MSLFPSLFYYDDIFEPFSTSHYLLDYNNFNSNNQNNNNQNTNQNNKCIISNKEMNSILKVDLIENENEFQVHADLPGVEEKDLDISIENNHLIIKGHREKNYEIQNATEHRIERSYGKVQRSIRLPSNADQSSCNAEFENGLLIISLKKKDKMNERRIKKITITNNKDDNQNKENNKDNNSSDENNNNPKTPKPQINLNIHNNSHTLQMYLCFLNRQKSLKSF